jgi:hypothetical protein
MVGEAEAPLERAPGNAAMQVAAVLVLLLRLAGDKQRAFLHDDVDLVAREPGNRHRQAIGILAGLLDVVRRVGERGAVDMRCRIDQARQTIKADRRTEQRREIEAIHDQVLQ